MSLTLAIAVFVSLIFACLVCNAAMEQRETALRDDVSPALLRVRIDIFERRIRQLEEAQTKLFRQIEERQARGESVIHLREVEHENDEMLLELLRQVIQARRELERMLPSSPVNDDNSDIEENRKDLVEQSLYFQKISAETEEESLEEGTKEGTILEKSARNETSSHREYIAELSSTPTSECSICLDGYSDGETLGWSKCDDCPHVFHADCLTSWLQQSDRCPLCRVEIVQSAQSRDPEVVEDN